MLHFSSSLILAFLVTVVSTSGKPTSEDRPLTCPEPTELRLRDVDCFVAIKLAGLDPVECPSCKRGDPKAQFTSTPAYEVEFVPSGGHNGQCQAAGCDLMNCKWTGGQFQFKAPGAHPAVTFDLQSPSGETASIFVAANAAYPGPYSVNNPFSDVEVTCSDSEASVHVTVKEGENQAMMPFTCKQCN